MRFRPQSACKRRDAQPFFDNAFSPRFQSSLPSARISAYCFAVLRSLRLMDFRCFASLDLDVPAEGAILTGDNAQGKTSILEALCVLVRLHSPRTHRLATMARVGSKGFGIAGDPWGSERQVRYSREGMVLKIDEQIRPSQTRYLEDGELVVWMGNEDLELVRGPGEGLFCLRAQIGRIGCLSTPWRHDDRDHFPLVAAIDAEVAIDRDDG
jgi:hypothetical protein